MFTVDQSVGLGFGQFVNVRKRQRAGALQDAVAWAGRVGASASSFGLAGKPLIFLPALFCTLAVAAQTNVATPVFTPASGASVPTNVTMTCATPGAVIYYTLDGSLPTNSSSTLYTGAVHLVSASTVRAVGFTNGWTPSASGVAYYGAPAAPANAQVTRSVNTSSPTAPVVTFSVTPGSGASCVAVTEALPPGLAATGVTAGRQLQCQQQRCGLGAVFRHECADVELYGGRAAGDLSAARDLERGRRGRRRAGGNKHLGHLRDRRHGAVPAAASGDAGLHAGQRGECANQRDDDLRDARRNDSLHAGRFVAHAVVHALQRCGPADVGEHGAGGGLHQRLDAECGRRGVLWSARRPGQRASDAQREHEFTHRAGGDVWCGAGHGASCVAVTESLPPGLAATGVTAGGNYIASNNVVVWGPFFGTSAQTLSYTVVGQPGTYPVRATWSVDGVGGGETAGTNSWSPSRRAARCRPRRRKWRRRFSRRPAGRVCQRT